MPNLGFSPADIAKHNVLHGNPIEASKLKSFHLRARMMVDEEILSFTERTGKGGHHRVYRLEMTKSELKEYLARIVIDKLLIEYPEESKRVTSNLQPTTG